MNLQNIYNIVKFQILLIIKLIDIDMFLSNLHSSHNPNFYKYFNLFYYF